MTPHDAASTPGPRTSPEPDGRASRPVPRAVSAVLTALLVLLASTHGLLPAAAAAGWTWPVKPKPAVTRTFQPPAQKWLSGHRGVDLAAAPGTEIRSPAAGTVSFSGVVVDRPVITVDHGNGLKSSFEPLDASVKRGESVTRGQVIGRVAGAGHCPPDHCVHWGVRRDGEYVNPLQFVQDMRPSVLLPVPESV